MILESRLSGQFFVNLAADEVGIVLAGTEERALPVDVRAVNPHEPPAVLRRVDANLVLTLSGANAVNHRPLDLAVFLPSIFRICNSSSTNPWPRQFFGRNSSLKHGTSHKLGVIQDKWGEALNAGFQIVPNVLFRAQSQLRLDAVDVVILLNLTAHWWRKEAQPFISPARIARRMNVSTRTVERHLKKLEGREFIRRSPGARMDGGPYIRHYDLTPLVGVLKEASRTALTLRARRAEQPFQQV